MWNARTKTDLIIEVWEKLDCEDVGAAEIEAIEIVLMDHFGPQALDSPMKTARLLADEGAQLRHSEIMELYLARAQHRPYEAAFNNILNVSDLKGALSMIRSLENLRRKYTTDGDREGLRLLREHALAAKQNATETARRERVEPLARLVGGEIADWVTVWLQTPAAFEAWVTLRQRSHDFRERFGPIEESGDV